MKPRHVAIIMDGNGRWAKERGWPRILGHREGARNVHRITEHASNQGIKVLTLYAFSSENWLRPEKEVSLLMLLLRIYAVRERIYLMRDNIQLRVIGDISMIPERSRTELEKSIEMTSHNSGMVLQLALNYGGRQEIVEAAKKISESVREGRLDSTKLNAEVFGSFLQSSDLPEPDLMIRTSGEQRLSNFLLWQSAYSELHFSVKYWPEFSASDFDDALESFSHRERRFGGVA